MDSTEFYVQRSNTRGELWMTVGPMAREEAMAEANQWKRAGNDARVLECEPVGDGEAFEDLLKIGKARVV